MNTQANLVSDIVEENGKTVKENNLEKKHSIPVGSLVQINCQGMSENGLRLFVMNHTRDCDGTPLYKLTGDSDYIGFEENEEKDLSAANKLDVYMSGRSKGIDIGKSCGEWGEESLMVVRLPDETVPTIMINHPSGRYSLDDLKADLEAAVAKGYNHDFAFTVHTVRGLIEKIDELSGV